ncbi:MAG: hypothetical protein QOF48_1183, partial [Verrucomicrobiota bacterium]
EWLLAHRPKPGSPPPRPVAVKPPVAEIKPGAPT